MDENINTYPQSSSSFYYNISINENTDINVIVDYINILNDDGLSDKKIKEIYETFHSIVKKFHKNKEFYKIKRVKNELEKYYDKYSAINKLLVKIYKSFHKIGKELIESNIIICNMDIINFIKEDYNGHNMYRPNKIFESFKLIDYIQLDTIDDKFISVLNEFIKIFRNVIGNIKEYEQILDIIIKKAHTFEHLLKLYKIFNIENDDDIDDYIIDKLIKILTNIFLNNDIIYDNIIQGIGFLYVSISINRFNNKNEHLTNINNILNQFFKDNIHNISLSILKIFGNQFSNDIILSFLTNKIIENQLTNNDIVILLNSLSDKNDTQLYLLDMLQDRIINNSDIFNIEFTENIKLLYYLIKMNFFRNIIIGNNTFIDKTVNNINIIRNRIIRYVFSLNQLMILNYLNNSHKNIENINNNNKNNSFTININEENDLILLYKIISLNDETFLVDYNSLVSKINNCLTIINKIDLILNIFKEYYPNEERNMINEYNDLLQRIKTTPISNFPSENQIRNFGKLYRIAQRIKTLKTSKIFNKIYKKIKSTYYISNNNNNSNDESTIYNEVRTKESDLVNISIEKFNNIVNIFFIDTENDLDFDFFEEILIDIENTKLNEEVIYLNNIFKLNVNDLGPITRKLKLLKNRKYNINLLEKIIILLKDFQTGNINFDNKNKDCASNNINNNEASSSNTNYNEAISSNTNYNKASSSNTNYNKASSSNTNYNEASNCSNNNNININNSNGSNSSNNNNININNSNGSNSSNRQIKIELGKNIEFLKKYLDDRRPLEKLVEVDNSLNELNINILNSDMYSNVQDTIISMYNVPELITFILNRQYDDIKQMGEFINDMNGLNINSEDIYFLEGCASFVYNLKEKCLNLSEKEILDEYINLINEKHNNISMNFEKSSEKYNEFNNLKIYYLNPNGLNIVHIRGIIKNSIFKLKFENEGYICNSYYEIDFDNKSNNYINSSINNNNEENKKFIPKEFDEILELRDIALLGELDDIKSKFVDIVTDINEIMKILGRISTKGYFKDLNYLIKIKNGESFKVINNNNLMKKDLKMIIDELNDIENYQKNIINLNYLSNPVTQLIYGKQFSYINKFINDQYKIEENRNLLSNLFKFVTCNNFNNYNVYMRRSNHNSPLKRMFDDVTLYLSGFLRLNNLDLSVVYQNAQLLNKSYAGIYSYSCSLDDIEYYTLYCSMCFTGHIPIAQTVLCCNENTLEEEIVSFIYRSMLCKSNTLFIIMKPENLKLKNKKLLIELVKSFTSKKHQQEMNSCLLFIYNIEKIAEEVIIEIENLPNHQTFNLKKNINQPSFPNIKIYSSDISGLGKSTLIKSDFENELNNEYKYVYFPLGGNLKESDIIERLLKLTDFKIGLHIDLQNSDQIELIKEFLFSFLILKYYSCNEKIFYYSNEIIIKVELPNTFVDFKKLYPILNFFENHNIKINELPPLIISDNDEFLNYQIVANYILNINEINKKDLYFINYNSKDDKQINTETIDINECLRIILDKIKEEKYGFKINNLNYYQIYIYIKLVSSQLRLFTNSIYFNVEQLQNIIVDGLKYINEVRGYYVSSLFNVTKYFITSSYDNILKEQNITFNQQIGKIDYELAVEQEQQNLLNKKVIFIDDIRPSMMLFNEDEQSISIIPTCKIPPRESGIDYSSDPEYKEYYTLFSAYNSNSINKNMFDFLDYKDLSTKGYLEKIHKILNINKPVEDEYEIAKSYVFTKDNFFKLILIYLKIQSNIPVILMGETGCGKTSLIRIITKLKGITLHIINIHAGIDDDKIIKKLKSINLFKNSNLNAGENKDSSKYVWVFFDEINTCNSIELLTEIILKHSCKGEKLRDDIKIIAACNPYRLSGNCNNSETIGLRNLSNNNNLKLVYNVYPLMHSLLNFIFDFGTPEDKDITKYIINMVTQIVQHLNKKENISDDIKNIAFNSIAKAHHFIKDEFDISSVSLREIRRWGILFEWFIDFLNKPYISKKLQLDQHHNNQLIYFYSLNLSNYLCYYIRIYNKQKRQEFLSLMSTSDTFGKGFDFEEFPRKVQNLIADEVNLEKGIARNKALLDNLFAIFVCINTKIPLFIVGKPGCSKSLSAQLIFKSMNGEHSLSDFFKLFGKAYINSYQGSLTSDSEGVLKLFKRARETQTGENVSRNVISVIFFDEMSLAEASKKNPLKVIHSQLEYDDNEIKVSFIGTSNWSLDASKMNRGIYLSIPEPDKEDLEKVAVAIAESYDERLVNKYEIYYKILASTYYQYKEKLKNEPYNFKSSFMNFVSNDDNKYINEFHGMRDFYHLIKLISNKLMKNYPDDPKIIEDIICEGIERNFGALDNSIIEFKKIYNDNNCRMSIENLISLDIEKKYDPIENIIKNITDKESRYTLIITNNSIGHFLINLILNELQHKYEYYYGSCFEKDNNESHYSAKMLNKIQSTIIHDNIMVLSNLISSYPSLYDLFNQNYRIIGNNKYTRIALGNSNTRNAFVNDNLRIIVIIDVNGISKQDPPFLNRFEKYYLNINMLLREDEIQISEQIYLMLTSIYKDINNNNKPVKIDFKYQLINCNLEELQGIIYKMNEEIIKRYQKIIEQNNNNEDKNSLDQILESIIDKSHNQKILETIVPTFSQDIIFYMKYSNFSKMYAKEYQNIENIYMESWKEHKNLKTYLSNIMTPKHIIYTFSNIFDTPFEYKDDNKEEIIPINNEEYGPFTKVKNIYVSHYNSENDIDEVIEEYLTNNDENIGLFHFSMKDIKHLIHLNYLIDNHEKKLKNSGTFKTKVILFIVHLKRKIIGDKQKVKKDVDIISDSNELQDDDYENIINNNLLSHLTQWKQFFIDNLNRTGISYKSILNSDKNFFENKLLFNLDNDFNDNVNLALNSINYNFKMNLISPKIFNYFNSIEVEEYKSVVYHYIIGNDNIKTMIKSLAFNILNQFNNNFIIRIFTEYNFENNETDFISVVIKYMNSIYKNVIKYIIIQLEKQNVFSTLIFGEKKSVKLNFDDIYKDNINMNDMTLSKFSNISDSEKVDLILGITYPCIINIFNEASNYIREYDLLEDYNTNEYSLMNNKIKLKEYYHNRNEIKERLKENVFENKYFHTIFQHNEFNGREISNYQKKQLLKVFFNDYIHFYLSKTNNKYFNSNILKFFNVLYSLFVVNNINDKNQVIDINDDELYDYDYIIIFMLFLEFYREIIEKLMKYIIDFDSYLNDFFDCYISQISLNMFIYINNKRIDLININNNLLDSVIYCIITSPQFVNMTIEKMKPFTNTLMMFYKYMKSHFSFVNLKSSYVYYAEDLIYTLQYFIKYNIPIKNYMTYLKKENQYYLVPMYEKIYKENNIPMNEDLFLYFNLLKGRNQNDLFIKNNILSNEFNYLSKTFRNNEDYLEFLIYLLNIKVNISDNEVYRVKLLEIICTDELIDIFSSNALLKEKYQIFYEVLFSNFDIKQYEHSEILKYLNKMNNRNLDDLLIQIFNNKISKELFDSNNNNNKQNELIFNIDEIYYKLNNVNSNNKYALLYCRIFQKQKKRLFRDN